MSAPAPSTSPANEGLVDYESEEDAMSDGVPESFVEVDVIVYEEEEDEDMQDLVQEEAQAVDVEEKCMIDERDEAAAVLSDVLKPDEDMPSVQHTQVSLNRQCVVCIALCMLCDCWEVKQSGKCCSSRFVNQSVSTKQHHSAVALAVSHQASPCKAADCCQKSICRLTSLLLSMVHAVLHKLGKLAHRQVLESLILEPC